MSILTYSVYSESYAQHTFLKYLRYGNPLSNCHGWSVQQALDGNVIVQFKYQDNFSLGVDFGIFTLNKYGDSLNTYVYNLEGDDLVENIVIDNPNTIYATGTKLSNVSNFAVGILYKLDLLDSNNNQYNFYSNIEGNYYFRNILKNNHSLYLIGDKKYINSSLNYNIHKTNLAGITIFDSTYIAAKADFSNESSFNASGDIIITGGSYTGSQFEARVFTTLIDTNGNEKWKSFVGIEGDVYFDCRSIGTGAVQAVNGNYYISGFTDNWCDPDISASGDRSLLICLDSNGNHLWTKKQIFNNYLSQSFVDIHLAKDGNLMIIGQADLETPSSPLKNNTQIIIAKYDLNGNIVWTREYGKDSTYEFVYGSNLSNDGGLLITGRFENLYNPFYDVQTFVMKLDDCGCLVPNCDPNCIATGLMKETPSTQIKLYPNPTNGIINLESNVAFKKYLIINTLGQIVKSGMLEKNAINIHTLQNGIYILQLENDTTSAQQQLLKTE